MSCLSSLIVLVEEAGPSLLCHQCILELHVLEQSRHSSVGSVMDFSENSGTADIASMCAQRRRAN